MEPLRGKAVVFYHEIGTAAGAAGAAGGASEDRGPRAGAGRGANRKQGAAAAERGGGSGQDAQSVWPIRSAAIGMDAVSVPAANPL